MIIERRLSPNYSWALATHRQTANLETPRWQSHRGKSHERKMTGDAVVMFTITQAHRVLARVKQRCERRPSLFLLCTRLSFTVQHTVRFSVQQRVVFQAQFHHVKLHNSLSISRNFCSIKSKCCRIGSVLPSLATNTPSCGLHFSKTQTTHNGGN